MARVTSAKAEKPKAQEKTPTPAEPRDEQPKRTHSARKAGAEQPRGDVANISGVKPEMEEHTQHPLGKIFPRLNDQERKELIEDIRANGLREKITVTPDGAILDGWGRYQACLKAGVTPQFVEIELPPEKWAEYVISKNMMRRHLTPSQRAAIVAEFVTAKHGDNQYTRGSVKMPVLTRKDAAVASGTSEKLVREAVKVKKADPKVLEEVKAGKMSVGEAASKLQPKPTAGSGGKTPEKVKADDRREDIVPDAAPAPAQEAVTEADQELARWFMGKLRTVDEYKKVVQLIRLSNPAGVVAALRELEPARRLGDWAEATSCPWPMRLLSPP